MNKKKIIITGGTGQDGSYLIEYLLDYDKDNSFEIVAIVRRTSKAILDNLSNVINDKRLRIETIDICDPQAVRNLIKAEKPDYFFNLGAQTFVADSWVNPIAHMNTNATSLIPMLEAIKEYVPNCRFYSAGSSEQWGDVVYSPQDEKHPMRPRSVYGVSKCAAQLMVKVYRESYNLYAVHGILLNHESERRQVYFISRKITDAASKIFYSLKAGEHVNPVEVGNLDAKRDWSHAKDFVKGIWMMLNQEVYNNKIDKSSNIVKQLKEYVLSSNETHSVREFVELAFKSTGILNLPRYRGYDFSWIGSGLDEKFVLENGNDFITLLSVNKKYFRPAEVNLLLGDSTLARNELGWSPEYNFKELVSAMIKNDLKINSK